MGKSRGLFGWMIGILTGTALGVLFAPRKGRETRDRIQKARKSGGFGHEPLFADIKKLGEEIGAVTKGAYKHSELPSLIRTWRKKLQELSEEFVEDVEDFHEEKVAPWERKAKSTARLLKQKGKKVEREAKRAIRKAKTGGKVVKRAAREVHRVFKKK